ncbi:MAG: hypothetical protein H0X46_06145, partial [Bacteroidetes bacterium]|nr:hypothetical protein [Bacteroidota bacterium]
MSAPNRIFLLTLALLFVQVLFGQSAKIDSLRSFLTSSKDTQQVNLLNTIANAYLTLSDPDHAMSYAEKAREASIDIDYYSGAGRSLLTQGKAMDLKGSYDSAIIYFNQAIPFLEPAADINDRASCYQSLA